MKNKTIIWLTDMDLKGSGYLNISVNLCEGLMDLGHDIFMIGLGYEGNEHNYPMHIIPTVNFKEAFAMIQNFINLGKCEALVVALDIPIQEQILPNIKGKNFKYIGIMPVESDPLCMSWAILLQQMDKPYIISKFGELEAHKKGVMKAQHLPIGINLDNWSVPTEDEKVSMRKGLGFDEDEFIVLTVADNQERKNLAAGMEAFANLLVERPNSRWILVTREHSLVGWKLRDLAEEFRMKYLREKSVDININDKITMIERGITPDELWAVYACSDVFMLTSKAEGLGMPLLEAMAMKIPCVATDCTGMRESLSNDRGILIPYTYKHRDTFGNGNRYWISIDELSGALIHLHDHKETREALAMKAYDYIMKMTWDIPIKILHEEVDKNE